MERNTSEILEWIADPEGSFQKGTAEWKELSGAVTTLAKSVKTAKQNAPYGYCPFCGSPGHTRERRPNGNDTCVTGHSYKSGYALSEANRHMAGSISLK